VLSDAAPKPVQVQADATSPPPSGSQAGSEWNQAGTWEEKDMSSWVKEKLSEWLQNSRVKIPEVALTSGKAVAASGSVTKVKSITGDAQIVMVRNKPRHGYNFEAELSFKLSFTGSDYKESASGTLTIPELMDATVAEELKIDHAWKGSAPPEELGSLAAQCMDKLKGSVRMQVKSFYEEYKQKKAGKAKPAAKSIVTLDVKPWDDETSMKELEESVRGIEQDGLVWGGSSRCRRLRHQEAPDQPGHRGRQGLPRRAPGEDRGLRGLRPELRRCCHAEALSVSLPTAWVGA